MSKISPNAMLLIKWSVIIQASFSALVLLYACGSLLLGQLNPSDRTQNESVNYNLITFVVSLWFPSPIFMLLTGEDKRREDSHDDITYNQSPVSYTDPRSLTSLRDEPPLPPYNPNERV